MSSPFLWISKRSLVLPCVSWHKTDHLKVPYLRTEKLSGPNRSNINFSMTPVNLIFRCDTVLKNITDAIIYSVHHIIYIF